MRIYTKKGDDGTTGLYYGGRVRKDAPAPCAYGDVDEAQSVIGLARADAGRGSELDIMLIGLERDLWVLMADRIRIPVVRRERRRPPECSHHLPALRPPALYSPA